MQGKFEQYGVGGIWHFTDRSNIELIEREGGLLSLEEIERRGIRGFVPGGNELSHRMDEARGVKSYIHLAFLCTHPMQYVAVQEGRIKNSVWMRIKPHVALADGVRFTTDVSNKTGVEVLTPDEARDQIDFEVLFTRTDWADPEMMARRRAAEKSEILVPDFISFDDIEQVF